MTFRHLAAAFSAAMSGVLLGVAAVEAVQGDLLVIKAGRVSVFSVVVLVLWFAANIYVAWPYLRDSS